MNDYGLPIGALIRELLDRWFGGVEEPDGSVDFREHHDKIVIVYHSYQPMPNRDKKLRAVEAILTGKAHARTYPVRKGDRGFRMEVTE